jgi:hypothetical protein
VDWGREVPRCFIWSRLEVRDQRPWAKWPSTPTMLTASGLALCNGGVIAVARLQDNPKALHGLQDRVEVRAIGRHFKTNRALCVHRGHHVVGGLWVGDGSI